MAVPTDKNEYFPHQKSVATHLNGKKRVGEEGNKTDIVLLVMSSVYCRGKEEQISVKMCGDKMFLDGQPPQFGGVSEIVK